MATRPVPFSEIKRTVEVYHQLLGEGWPATPKLGQLGAISLTGKQLGLHASNLENIKHRLDTAVALGIQVREWRVVDMKWAADTLRRYQHYDEEYQEAMQAFGSPGSLTRSQRGGRRDTATRVPPTVAPPSGQTQPEFQPDPHVELALEEIVAKVAPALRRNPLSLDALAQKLGVAPFMADFAVALAHARGVSVNLRGGLWHLDDAPAMGSQQELGHRLVSDADGVLRFASVGDSHLCSKYAREDCLSDFYDHVAHRGLSVVLHAGNWIDGEATFNKHDLLVHGMDPQMQYLAKNYPHRPGVETWAITGEDHEGWYSRREGVDVGRYAENAMRQNGRTDWHDVGFMETFIDLVHGGTGKSCKLLLMHPGGGSAYAVSYQPQKIVESFDGGDKPAVLILGHYHKASYNLIRNVHTIQTGAFQDQTLFMRKLKIASHLAGCFIELKLDPETGAVNEFTTTFRNYFVRDYYRNRWSQHGPVEHAKRSA